MKRWKFSVETYLLLEFIDLCAQQSLFLIRVDSVRHELEIRVVFTAELLQQPIVLLLHLIISLTRQLDLIQQSFFLLQINLIKLKTPHQFTDILTFDPTNGR